MDCSVMLAAMGTALSVVAAWGVKNQKDLKECHESRIRREEEFQNIISGITDTQGEDDE